MGGNITQLIHNMGWKYIVFRLWYEVRRKTGLLTYIYPTSYTLRNFISLSAWRNVDNLFFRPLKQKNIKLREDFERIINGEFCYFSSLWYAFDNDWVTNPDTGYQYAISHWTKIEDIDKNAGDIKYVWEKSRFSFLYTVIRYDYHFDEDHAQWIFERIADWIDKNPINCGPNYKCGQEISLRVLNWIFALDFYKNSMILTEAIFQKIMNSIYWQMRHVYSNINFSKIAVRNNHAITETLTLYLVGLLFPCFPDSHKWRRNGKKWFEQEIMYQIAEDGTYLQFSMNYHRVVIQLLTWAIALADKQGEQFNEAVYRRAYSSVNFLYQCQEESSGFLPNYGANDGALFFTLNNNDYRDYRPQLDALYYLLTGESLYRNDYEDRYWYCGEFKPKQRLFQTIRKQYGMVSFTNGGYYLIREKDTLTFIRCGTYKDRPAHADNLHIDVWYKGENVLLDGGTYKYNTEDKLIHYFSGTESHNTVMLDNYDQMLKGARFIWYNWSQAERASILEKDDGYYFTGTVRCFTYLDKEIRHTRNISKIKNKPVWLIEDIITHKPARFRMRQLWHTRYSNVQVAADGLKPVISKGLHSLYYGQMEETSQIEFITDANSLKTTITMV